MSEMITGDEVLVIIFILAGNCAVFYCVKQCFSCWKYLGWGEKIINMFLLLAFILQVTFTIFAIGNSHFYKTLMLWYG